MCENNQQRHANFYHMASSLAEHYKNLEALIASGNQSPMQNNGVSTITAGEQDKQSSTIIPASKRKRRPGKNANTAAHGIPLQNRFGPLEYESTDDDSSENEEAPQKRAKASVRPKKEKIPPITIQQTDVCNQGALLQMIRSLAQDKNCKINYKREHYKVQCNSVSSHKSLLAGLQLWKESKEKENIEINFFTHEFPHDKNKRIIAKGLPLLEPNEIKMDLLEKEIKCDSVIILAKKDLPRNTKPVYLLTFDKSVNLKDVRALRYVYNVKVTWEKYKNRKGTTQCHRCQQFGHGSSKCFFSPRCLHCGENHLTGDCSKKDDQPFCANCQKEHRANSKECETYTKRVSFLSSQRYKSQPPKRPPAPPPPTRDDFPHPGWETCAPEGRGNPAAWNTSRAADVREVFPRETVQDFTELTNVMKSIQQLIDVKKMLTIFKNLESNLKNCSNEQEKFAVFFTFMTNNGP